MNFDKEINNIVKELTILSIEDNKRFQPIINDNLIDIKQIENLPTEYPEEFNNFCKINNLKPPNINTGNGKALSVMLKYKNYYWNRETCELFVKKFNIKTADSIQLFNKHNQWGIQTNSGKEREKLYIVYQRNIK